MLLEVCVGVPVIVLEGVCVKVPDCVAVFVAVPDVDIVLEGVVEGVTVLLNVIFPEAV